MQQKSEVVTVLRVLVVDDEPLGRRRLLALLERESDIEVVGTASDGEEAVVAIRTERPDLVFLDVQMPRMSGVEVVQAIGSRSMPATIFVTAYDQYALSAFDAAAVDYLVKPFRDSRFREALDRARRRVASDERERVHEQLMSLLRAGSGAPGTIPPPIHSTLTIGSAAAQGGYLERIAVDTRGKLRVVPVAQVDYITASGQYAELHVGTHRYVIRDSMQHLEERLDPQRWMRIHRSAIVQLDRVAMMLRNEGSEYWVQLHGGVRLRVGRSRREALEARLRQPS